MIIRPEYRKYLRDICNIYGVKLRFSNRALDGGLYWKGTITLGQFDSLADLIDVFCHELGHYRNDIEGRHPIYHKLDAREAVVKYGIKRFSYFALQAEIYTEKMGKEFASIWFPGHKYAATYRNSQYWKGFFFGYYC